jgi:hypothetical protein
MNYRRSTTKERFEKTMTKVIRRTIGFAVLAAFHLAGSPTFAQTNSSPPADAPLPENNQPIRPDNLPQPDSDLDAQTVPTPTESIAPSCPAGQFASAFPDVRPEHWAYEAVNRLAIGSIRCFPR